jgi:hypothetical protein
MARNVDAFGTFLESSAVYFKLQKVYNPISLSIYVCVMEYAIGLGKEIITEV